jgi:hypothetical protein
VVKPTVFAEYFTGRFSVTCGGFFCNDSVEKDIPTTSTKCALQRACNAKLDSAHV